MTTQISKLNVGKVNFQGMIETVRDKKSIQFIVLKDFSGKIQVTVDKTAHPEVGEVFSHLLPGSTVLVSGELIKSEYVKMGGQEVLAESVVVTSDAKEPYPITPESNIDQRIDFRWIDLRQEKNLLMFKVQTLFTEAMREFLLERDFTEFHSPKLIGTASESGSEVFEVKYFDRKAYLAQSPQFYKQLAISAGWGRVFECGPVFRAEKSHSRKHATEFTGFDLEFSGIEGLQDVINLESELLTYALKKVKENYEEQIKEAFGVEIIVPTLPFPQIKLPELYKELEKRYNYKVDDIIQLISEKLEVDKLSTGSKDEIGVGEEFSCYRTLSYLMQFLSTYPGKGIELIKPALRMPVVNCRFTALRVIEQWVEIEQKPLKTSFPELYQYLCDILPEEVREDAQKKMNELIEGILNKPQGITIQRKDE